VPHYVKGFDVGIVPYRLTEYTANVYPAKLNEYLVMGIPVVATDLPEVRRFVADHGDVVAVGADADSFAAAIRRALTGSSPSDAGVSPSRARTAGQPHRCHERAHRGSDDARDNATTMGRRCGAYRARSHTAQIVLGCGVSAGVPDQHRVVVRVAEAVGPPVKADAIVVLAGGVRVRQAGGGHQESERAVILRAGYANVMVLSSGFTTASRKPR
jgi:hypothetical protein